MAMSPDQLALKGTESGEQKALFCWAAVARVWGFDNANSLTVYATNKPAHPVMPVPEFEWLHAVPNGGLRDPITAARMKAEGVRKGVADIFLPVKRGKLSGLYLELKTLKGGRVSEEQLAFGSFVQTQGYAWASANGWRNASQALQLYMEST